MIKLTKFKAVHTGGVLGYLASKVRKRLNISRFVLGVLIKEGFIVVDIKHFVDLEELEKAKEGDVVH